ncbi:MAG: formate dehydrogenase accessory sulfurtransferase FdhD [Clostridiales bacterium]|nr:formate dehydrogenase accessory sulfurtransferase FdhD [Clostridiales bacterium]
MKIGTTKYPIKRYQDGRYSELLDDVLEEYVLSIYLEDALLVKLICVPEYLEELVLGYLYSDGLIASAEDVESIMIEGQAARVTLAAGAAAAADLQNAKDADLIVTDSGDFVEVPYRFRRPAEVVLRKAEWDPDVVLQNANLLLEKSKIFRETGNVHSVMICRGAELLYFCEDIGRYNAFDKCMGRALKDKTDLSHACVYTSGRIPSSIALKTLRAGIPMIVSRSAPTDLTLRIAAEYGLTVVGFARGDRFNLY